MKNVGAWLNVNSEAIYGSIYWDYQGDSINNEKVWYTQVDISFHESMKNFLNLINELCDAFNELFFFSQKMGNRFMQYVLNGQMMAKRYC